LYIEVISIWVRSWLLLQNFLSHPSHQVKIPVYQGFRWVNPLEMLKPPKSGQGERLVKLNRIAIQQMQVLEGNSNRNLLK